MSLDLGEGLQVLSVHDDILHSSKTPQCLHIVGSHGPVLSLLLAAGLNPGLLGLVHRYQWLRQSIFKNQRKRLRNKDNRPTNHKNFFQAIDDIDVSGPCL